MLNVSTEEAIRLESATPCVAAECDVSDERQFLHMLSMFTKEERPGVLDALRKAVLQ